MQPLDKINVLIKTGQELLSYYREPLNFCLSDFWKWSSSDILSNATRGRFAEFIVATATNIDTTIVDEEYSEWNSFDLKTPTGIKLEIKTSAYLQSWGQEKLSEIKFSIKETQYWDIRTNKYYRPKIRHADVYVFCLLHHKDKQTVDPLNLNQWDFYILATKQLNDHMGRKDSIRLKPLQNLTNRVTYENLNAEVKIKNALNQNTNL